MLGHILPFLGHKCMHIFKVFRS